MSERIHCEEYLYLPALTHDAAIIAWGGFFFEVEQEDDEEEWELLDDGKLPKRAGRKQSIGESSEAYAPRASVFVTEAGAGAPREIPVGAANHAVVRGLKPDTEYAYRVVVCGTDGQDREWAAGPLRDWVIVNGEGSMRAGGRYDNRFRTFPAPNAPSPALTFAVIGDFGRGVRKASATSRCQREVAEALEQAVNERDLRLILTTGDNIYAKTFLGIPTSASGDEDDDWFFTYFQPYRYIINRAPVFPAVGNHDEAENEQSVDREQIYDNLYLRAQFREGLGAEDRGIRPAEDASLDHGLFYRFRFGAEIEFVCLDTSKGGSGKRHFDLPENEPFIARAFAPAAPRWRIPYSHHPAYCAGPRHSSSQSLRKFLKERANGARVSFSGHEHNFQYARDAEQRHFVTGGGGKFRDGRLSASRLAAEMIQAWGGNDEGHFLLVEINGAEMKVTPIGHRRDGRLRPIKINPVGSQPVTPPFII
ncbi:MAG: purple acid phosphatase family protein [Blastocatellia bacterium]